MNPVTSLLRTLSVAALLSLLAACGISPGEISPGDLTTPAKRSGLSVQAKQLLPSTMPLMTTPGTYMSAPQGPLFEPMDTLDPRNAMIYVYRPSTRWEDQELQAPSFFIDGRRVFGLKSGSYTWLEVHGGEFRLIAKRPLSILYLKKIFELDMKIAGGRNYYLRYSEDSSFDYKAAGLDPADFMHDGPMQEVPEYVALGEIASLKLDQQGVYFAGRTATSGSWKPFDSFPETGREAEGPADDVPAEAQAKPGMWQRTKDWFGNLF